MTLSKKDIASIRTDYRLKEFDEQHLAADPFAQFAAWFHEAIHSQVNEPNAMTLCTADPDGQPHARIVLLKGFDHNGFVFFTNYLSDKGRQLQLNPQAALVFFWPDLERQVRVEGRVEKIDEAASDEYFFSRPTGSQIGAHASPQSQVIVSRKHLEDRVKEFEELFSKQPLLRPEHWGGYLLRPAMFEFWQGRSSRLHDRFLFRQNAGGQWAPQRLAP